MFFFDFEVYGEQAQFESWKLFSTILNHAHFPATKMLVRASLKQDR